MSDGHEIWDELAAGAALDALEPDEQRAFELHSADCSRCRQQFDSHRLIAAQLGSLSVSDDDDAPAPSWAELRARIIPSETAQSDPQLAEVTPIRRFSGQRRVLAVAAAAVVIAGGGVAAWQLTGSQTQQGSRPLASDCSLPGCHEIALRSQSGDAMARIIVKGHLATVEPEHMPAAPAGKAYVLWQMGRAGRPIPIRDISASQQTPAPLPLPYARTAAFAVSEENAGVLPKSPTKILATGPAS